MIKTIKISKRLLNLVNKDIYYVLTNLFKKKIHNHEMIFNFLRKNIKFSNQIFDMLNMLPILNYVSYEIGEQIKKKYLKKFLLNWTYPQIRLDDISSEKFKAPAHKDKWILNKNKKGYIVWIPLNQETSLLIAKKGKIKKIVKNSYWGLEAKGQIKFERKFIKLGNGLLFDSNLLHKSDDATNSRITLQLRFEEINYKNFTRSATQKINQEVLSYWHNKYA